MKRFSVILATCLFFFSMTAQQCLAESVDDRPRVVFRSGDGKTTNKKLNVVNVDVFWCSGDAKASSRAIQASELAASYGATASLIFPDIKKVVGEIRTRPIASDVLKGKLTEAEFSMANESALIVYDATNKKLRDFVKKVMLRTPKSGYASNANDRFVPNYVSVFTCSNFDGKSYIGRLYFQVRASDQKDRANRVASTLREKFLGLNIAREVEVVGNSAPVESELRYFFDGDKDLAEQVAREMNVTSNIAIQIRRVHGYENRIRKGTLEVWLSQ